MRKSTFLGAFLDSVNVAAVAVMLAVLFWMGYDTLQDWRSITIAVLGFVVTFGPIKVNPLWIVIGGSILGWLLMMV